MKRTEKIGLKKISGAICCGMFVLVMIASLCMPETGQAVSVNGSSHHNGWYHGMSYLAEQEIRAKAQRITENEQVAAATNIAVAVDRDEKETLNTPKKVDSTEK